MFEYWDAHDHMYLAINPLLILFLNDLYMKAKFPNSAKNVDNFPNLMVHIPCTNGLWQSWTFTYHVYTNSVGYFAEMDLNYSFNMYMNNDTSFNSACCHWQDTELKKIRSTAKWTEC